MHFKNEDCIKDLITKAHRNGTCDSDGKSVKRDGVYIAKPKAFSSTAKTYVYKDGRMVIKI